MKLESLPKFYSPKSPKLNDETPSTGGTSLTITDVMAAQGMVSSQARFGFNLFLAKMGIQDPVPAIEQLVNYALTLKNPVMSKLSENIRIEMASCLAAFAFNDYARSAASKSTCLQCNGQRVIRKVEDVVKHPGVKGVPPLIKREEVESTCSYCEGKGWVSTACRDCHGRGLVLDRKRTELHKVPVQKLCGRCNGKGYSRLPTTLVKDRVIRLVPDMTNYQWYSGYSEVINILVTKCWQEESYAEAELKRITS
ncbi:antitermination protein [Klebsiella variicola subsp. variicola]|uniref:antitermination protein n=1 Tax=Klebsiella variicola TaxID=244366 RepID=UPI002FDF1872